MATWHPRFETGHPEIDSEHREFMQQLDTLKLAIDGGAGRERIRDLIVILQGYALEPVNTIAMTGRKCWQEGWN